MPNEETLILQADTLLVLRLQQKLQLPHRSVLGQLAVIGHLHNLAEISKIAVYQSMNIKGSKTSDVTGRVPYAFLAEISTCPVYCSSNEQQKAHERGMQSGGKAILAQKIVGRFFHIC